MPLQHPRENHQLLTSIGDEVGPDAKPSEDTNNGPGSRKTEPDSARHSGTVTVNSLAFITPPLSECFMHLDRGVVQGSFVRLP